MTNFSKSTVAALLVVATAVPTGWAHHLPIRGFSMINCMGNAGEYATAQEANRLGQEIVCEYR